MKLRIILTLACALAFSCVAASAQDNKAKPAADAKVSSGERDMAQKIEKAQGPEAKLQAAAAFVKKYPTSTMRPKVAQYVAGEIANAQDTQLKISLAQAYLDIFNQPEEASLVNDALLNAYINAGQADEAFKMGAARLAKNPEDLDLLRALAIVASNETIKGNNAFAAQGMQYGAKAIELIEADKRPANVEEAKWASYKAEALPNLYRATGIIAYKTNDTNAAIARLEKAVALNLKDPGVYLVLSELTYNDYDRLTKEYNVASDAEKPAALARAQAGLDKVIESYAAAVAMTEGNAQYQQAHDALMGDLTKYYKFRHNNSDAGLQQLIDKYKKP
ncbi:MAG TPA: hypothetical protein VFA21_08330 [Pyrinomonadaceae bacterium]|nr:hypothetical protein [Pyrinomonadaceae bacterium]